jgi:hypothetical protein
LKTKVTRRIGQTNTAAANPRKECDESTPELRAKSAGPTKQSPAIAATIALTKQQTRTAYGRVWAMNRSSIIGTK